MDDALVTDGGRSFQMRAAAAPKARSLTIFNLVRGPPACWMMMTEVSKTKPGRQNKSLKQ